MTESSQERLMIIGTNLKRLREAKKLTQREVWEAAEVSKSSLTAYENGRSDPTGETIVKLAKALGVTTDELLLDDQERTVSEDMAPILRRFDALPEAIRHQARIAVKGVLFGYEQEALK
ncbi:TPA: helix-turn-helix domain-containing protein [Pseudomonas aeruginosa]